MEKFVIIVAGGSGKRMQSVLPKQFLEVKGIPVIMHTISRFKEYSSDLHFIVVLPHEHFTTWHELITSHNFTINHTLVSGGKERFHSVKNALEHIPEGALVAIHDGVRPFVSIETIERCFSEAEENGNAIPCIPVYETIRKISGDNSVTEDRSAFRLIQTPQVFLSSLIKKGYRQTFDPAFTDDASVIESLGEKIFLVEGNRENIKITDPSDLILANAFIQK
jgi:2-C-methyl-D-erythritol 4-phosphate cytidylyltransferase